MVKADILKSISANEIYLHYLGLPKFPDKNISSPFAQDKNPSFKLYKNGTFKCFSSGYQGDVWQFVAYLKHLDCKKDFNQVLSEVENDIHLNLRPKPKLIIADTKTIKKSENAKEKSFAIELKPFTKAHLDFYKRLGVSEEVLKVYKVSAVKYFQFWQESKNAIKKFPIFDGVIAFAYEVNKRYEVYIPAQNPSSPSHIPPLGGNTKGAVAKFFYNGLDKADIFGYEQLPNNCDHIIIAAGKKDCLVLNADGYNAISFRSENHLPEPEQIALLQSKLSEDEDAAIYICYDNDFDNPNNPGQAAQAKLIERFPFLVPIYLPDGFNDVAEIYYKGNNIKEAFDLAKEKVLAKSQQSDVYNEAKKTIFHVVERYLNVHYKIRYNSIKLELQYCPIGTSAWKKVNENSLFIEMQKKGINVSIDKLVSILKSDFTPEYNPVNTYFKNLPAWDKTKTDYIMQLAAFVLSKEPAQFLRHFKKWLVRTVKCATVSEYFNKQALIFVSPKQNDGKSTFCRFLCPPALSEYIAEDITNDKDARILLCRNFLINLDELAVLSKQEINSLKAFFSKTQINERLPYDRTNSIIPRIASFIGSTNQDEFLSDETGSVRWLCFTISGIDWNYKKEVDINRVWAQAYYLANDPSFECELTREDIAENEKRNKDFQILSIERELINKAFHIPDEETYKTSIFLTATEIMQHIIATEIIPARGLSKIAIGRAMKQEGFEREKSGGVYGYHVLPVKTSHIKPP